jgi:hypothetical protein
LGFDLLLLGGWSGSGSWGVRGGFWTVGRWGMGMGEESPLVGILEDGMGAGSFCFFCIIWDVGVVTVYFLIVLILLEGELCNCAWFLSVI